MFKVVLRPELLLCPGVCVCGGGGSWSWISCVCAHKEYAHARTDDVMGTKDWWANSGSALMETSAVRRPPRRLCEISLTASYCSDLEPSEGDGGTPPDAGLLLYGFDPQALGERRSECA